MILPDFKDFVANLPPKGRLLGIDWGARRIGIAVSDESWDFAFPRGIAEGIDKIKELIVAEKIVGIIIGLPLYADGTDSKTTAEVREFAEQLASQVSVPVGFIEENLTSTEAAERQKAEGRRQKVKEIDSEAAAIILENAIAMIKRLKNV